MNRTYIKPFLLLAAIVAGSLHIQAQTVCQTSANGTTTLRCALTENTTVKDTKAVVLEDGFDSNNFRFEAGVGYGQPYQINPSNENYIRSVTPQVPKTSLDINGQLRSDEVSDQITYFDGLGRPIQEISIAASPTGKDIVQPHAYDGFGREAHTYLPYTETTTNGSFRSNAVPANDNVSSQDYWHGKQCTFYRTNSLPNVETSSNPYAQKVFDNSPLNRVMEQGAPGADWQPANMSGSSTGHTQKFEYGTNAQYDVRLFEVNNDNQLVNTTGELRNNKYYYASGTLYKTIVKDENWKATDGTNHTTEEYKDLQGHVILKRSYTYEALETYYVYDDFGLLRYVLSPNAVPSISTPAAKDNATIKSLCYYYQYDDRHRMIIKQLPGAEPVYMVYDLRDRLVATQDGVQRASQKWSFTKYDELNRSIQTGVVNDNRSLTDMQNYVNYLSNYSEYANATFDPATHSYTNKSFPPTDYCYYGYYPASAVEYLTVTFYDNYNFGIPSTHAFNSAKHIDDYTDNDGTPNGYSDRLKGQVTATRVKVLGTSQWLTTVNYYDDKYRVIQSIKDNYPTGQGTISTLYDFTGKVLKTRNTNTFNGAEEETQKTYAYDHAGRLMNVTQDIENGPSDVEISRMAYNEIGQLQDKTLADGHQSVDYSYNIRGWLTGLNNPDAAKQADDTYNDLFAMKLNYNQGDNAQYNGNISSSTWNNNNTGQKRYDYTYDYLNRLTNGTCSKLTNSAWAKIGYQENMFYDANGNITELNRTSLNDALLCYYEYNYNGNQLINLVGDVQLGSYRYDANGNMTYDGHIGFNVAYNQLNLPQTVSKGSDNISYIYSAAGEKLAKLRNGTAQEYYTGSFTYKETNGTKALDYIIFDEGVVKKLVGGGYDYQYFLKDHLGNTRVVFRPNSGATGTEVLQSTDYYPFGLAQNQNPNNDNKYLYNGKELQDDNIGGTALGWYDYGMRQYDAQIGRFHCIDRFTEKYSSLSPYNYAANNPILLIDMNGDSLAIDQSIYSNKVLNQAFQIFANSKAGRAYLSQFAKAGQKLYGYTFKESGKYDKEGMNMAYTTGKSEDSERGSTNADNSNKTITVTMCTDQIKDESNESIYSATQTFTHESFIHGDLDAKDYMQDGSFNSSNISQKAKEMASGYKPNFQHYQVYLNYAKNGYNTQWPGQGYSVLQQANSILKLNKTPQQVVQQMWNYSGGVNIDNKGNATEFNW